MSSRPDVLFLCVANSARSQLAEGWARRLAPEGTGVHSAGSEPGHLNPWAVEVMAEVGIDISRQRSKPIADVPVERVGTVVTLCAEEICPVLAGEGAGELQRLHWPLADPARPGSAGEQRERFRAARDEIEARVREFFAVRALNEPRGASE